MLIDVTYHGRHWLHICPACFPRIWIFIGNHFLIEFIWILATLIGGLYIIHTLLLRVINAFQWKFPRVQYFHWMYFRIRYELPLFTAVCLQFYAQILKVTFCLKSFCTIVMIIAKSLLLKVVLLSTIQQNKKAL